MKEKETDRLGHTYVKENSAEMRIKCSTVHVKRKQIIRGYSSAARASHRWITLVDVCIYLDYLKFYNDAYLTI